MLGISHREHKPNECVWQHVRSFYCQLSNVERYHGSAMSLIMILCRNSYYKEQWMVVVTDEDRINHGRTTLMNGQASRRRHCCASWWTTEVVGQPSQRRNLSEYPQRRLGVTGFRWLVTRHQMTTDSAMRWDFAWYLGRLGWNDSSFSSR